MKDVGKFYGHFVYFVYLPNGHLVHFVVIWVYFFLFWYAEPRKIWQPCQQAFLVRI
jgi:hypothetical protein